MGNTKLGLPAKLLACFAYLAAFFSGYVAFILLAGYVMIREQNDWLRYHTLKAGVLMVIFSIISALISLIPSLLSWVRELIDIFGNTFRVDFIYNGQTWLNTTLSILEKVVFLLLGYKVFKGQDLAISPVDKLVNSLLGKLPAAPSPAPAPVPEPVVEKPQQPENH